MVVQKLETKEINNEVYIKSPQSLIPLLRDYYEVTDKEQFVIVALNGVHKVISIRTVSVGTLNKSLVHNREVYRYAIQENAAAIIAVHNHPSGDSNPSDEDVKTTEAIESAGNIIGIKLLDHIILGRDYFSFLEHDMLKGE